MYSFSECVRYFLVARNPLSVVFQVLLEKVASPGLAENAPDLEHFVKHYALTNADYDDLFRLLRLRRASAPDRYTAARIAACDWVPARCESKTPSTGGGHQY